MFRRTTPAPRRRHTSVCSPQTGQGCSIEFLEGRTLLSAPGLLAPCAPNDPYLYSAHAKVDGKTLQEWSAKWWQSVFAAPVYAADGVTLTNPEMVDGTAAKMGNSQEGHVGFLYGAFDGADHSRGTAAHPVNISAHTPLFMPVQNSEWSNPDTPSKESNYTTVPGNYTAAELAHFADVQTHATVHLSMSIDGHAIPEATLFTHRETAPIFSYNFPKTFNLAQVFFGEDISGRVSPAAADGYYLMLRPLSKGLHTIVFGGQSIDLSATPPQLGASGGTITYVINVLPDEHSEDDNGPKGDRDADEHAGSIAPSRETGHSNVASPSFVKDDGDILKRSGHDVF